MMRVSITVLLLLAAALAGAAKMDAPAQSASEAMDARLKKLETELRCLVCQNQTLADSNADLAEDLRREVRELAMSGKNDEEIKAYLVARYGDFVLYKPPMKPITWLLWVGPFALLVVGGTVWWIVLRRRSRAAEASAPASSEAQARGRKLLDEAGS